MKKAISNHQPSTPFDTNFSRRRVLVLGGLSLPATSLLSMLGGCGGEDSVPRPVSSIADTPATTTGPSVPLPPYSPTTTPAPAPTSTPVTPPQSAPVTHTPVVPRIATDTTPVVMNVAVYNAEFNSFAQQLPRRQVAANTPGAISIADPKDATKTLVFEDLRTYLKRTLDSKLALLNRAMLTAFVTHRPSEFDVSFFTAPEFFWNAPWSEFFSHAEISDAADFYLTTVTANVRKLIARFPACKYGNIVLLPGTVAVLKPASTPKDKDGNLIYTASNHLVCTHNLPLDDPHHPRPAYMIWPKRVVSGIDFINPSGGCSSGDEIDPNPVNPAVTNNLLTCVLGKSNDLTVQIERISSDVAQSFDTLGKLLSSSFKNDIISGLPFGIDICLDYAAASAQKNSYRMIELDDRRFKLDFLLSAGMTLSVDNYKTTPFIQYAVHNDGIQGSNENYRTEAGRQLDVKDVLYSDIWALQYDKVANRIYGDLATPLDSASPFDVNKGVIAVSVDDSFKPPADVDMKDMPPIADPLNAMQVRVWKLPVDVTDTGTYPSDISALAPVKCVN